jgi:polyhydroxybutyrate depolymerase
MRESARSDVRAWSSRVFLGLLALAALLVPITLEAPGARADGSVAARPSAGCSLPRARAAAPGITNQLLAAAGDQGAYVREIPSTYTAKTPMPVVVDLHGYGESATLQADLTALGAYGDSHGFITVTPQVAAAVPMWITNLGGKDLAWIGALLHTIDTTMCVDRNRTFVTGYSNGAFMASSIACQFAGQIAAVAPVSGIEDPSGCHPSRPVPVVTFHGTADQYVSYTGGLGPAALKLPAADGSSKNIGQELGAGAPQLKGPSVPSLTATWATRNGCAKGPSTHAVTSDVTLIAYRCPNGSDVELYRVTGGGHAWPGSLFSKAIESAIGKVTYTISANRIIWAFFQAHPLRR